MDTSRRENRGTYLITVTLQLIQKDIGCSGNGQDTWDCESGLGDIMTVLASYSRSSFF